MLFVFDLHLKECDNWTCGYPDFIESDRISGPKECIIYYNLLVSIKKFGIPEMIDKICQNPVARVHEQIQKYLINSLLWYANTQQTLSWHHIITIKLLTLNKVYICLNSLNDGLTIDHSKNL